MKNTTGEQVNSMKHVRKHVTEIKMHTCASISASNREEKSCPDENKHSDSVFETVGVRARDQDVLSEAQTYFTLKRF